MPNPLRLVLEARDPRGAAHPMWVCSYNIRGRLLGDGLLGDGAFELWVHVRTWGGLLSPGSALRWTYTRTIVEREQAKRGSKWGDAFSELPIY